MAKFKVGPIVGFTVECLCIGVTVGGIVSAIGGNYDFVVPTIAAAIAALINFPQLFRIRDKVEVKYYGKFTRAKELLERKNLKEEKRSAALEKIKEAARNGYWPAIYYLKNYQNK